MAATVPVVAAASIDQRFAQLIQQFGLTKNSFAISLGKTASVVQHLIDGRNKPGFDLMCKVFEVYPNVSRDWLLLGRGPMLVGSNGLSGPAVAAAQPAVPEPDFEPIDLADVAPRAARRPTVSRLQPEEIDATLALATAATVQGQPATTVSAATPTTAVAAETAPIQIPPKLTPAPAVAPAETSAPLPTAAAVGPRPARPFRPTARPVSAEVTQTAAPASVAAAAPDTIPTAAPVLASVLPHTMANPVPAPVAAIEQAVAPSAAILNSSPASTPVGGAEAYVAAAIHSQHLQHQLALAEMRNQHLLEQQQMLREMLAMARQNMV